MELLGTGRTLIRQQYPRSCPFARCRGAGISPNRAAHRRYRWARQRPVRHLSSNRCRDKSSLDRAIAPRLSSNTAAAGFACREQRDHHNLGLRPNECLAIADHQSSPGRIPRGTVVGPGLRYEEPICPAARAPSQQRSRTCGHARGGEIPWVRGRDVRDRYSECYSTQNRVGVIARHCADLERQRSSPA